METKASIRTKYKTLRNAMPENIVREESQRICQNISTWEIFQKAQNCFFYYPLGKEASLLPLFKESIQKRAAFPRTSGEEMDFCGVNSTDDFQEGNFHVMEPKDEIPAMDLAELEQEKTIVFTPGLVFDMNGGRSGYGKGFYDRFFQKYKKVIRVGIALSCQLADQIPMETYDIPMDYLVTPEKIYKVTDNRDENKQQEGIMELQELGKRAKAAEVIMRNMGMKEKEKILLEVAEHLVEDTDAILAANQKDMDAGREAGMHQGLLDRLMLNKDRIAQMAEGIRQVAELEDPVGEVLSMKQRPNGLMIGKKRVPLGVIGIIYESRPNVTADAFALCFKTGNTVILKGGSDAIHSNMAIVKSINETLSNNQLPEGVLSLIEDTSRETATAFMKMNEYVDVLIPRGGSGLIRAVVANATIPVIETGTGNCHIYVDETADLDMAVNIINNAKTQRIGVCNACESLVLHENIVDELMPRLSAKLSESHVEIRGDERVQKAAKDAVAATEKDWGTEYLDYIISAKTVSDIDEAITHINKYNTGHSEAIITNNYEHAQKFLNEIDAAAVYVNASTRFTDGFEFGFGAEIGISTQKLHARGPMGLEALTTTKFIIYGDGQIRE